MRLRLLFVTGLFCATAAVAQPVDPQLQTYLTRNFPICTGGTVQIEPIAGGGPRGFVAFRAKLSSPDGMCGRETFALMSPATKQMLVADVFSLPRDGRPLDARIGEVVTRVLKKQARITISPIGFEDGIREVTITTDGKEGPFDFHGYLDESQSFLIVGRRGNLAVDPRTTFVEELSRFSPARRGKADAAIRIIEISDFQCPSCKQAHDNLKSLMSKNMNRVSYSRVDLPIFEGHDWSLNAALGARAIQRLAPDKYWQYVDYIFANQEAIRKETIDTVVQDFVESSNLDWAKVSAIYRSPAERKKMIDQVGRLFDLGIYATPTYIVNGQEIVYGKGGEHLKKYLEGLLAPPAKSK